jgi:hypothetical protein
MTNEAETANSARLQQATKLERSNVERQHAWFEGYGDSTGYLYSRGSGQPMKKVTAEQVKKAAER